MEEEQEEEAVEEKEDALVEPAHNIESTPVRDQPQPPTPPLFTTKQQQTLEHEAPLVQPEDVPPPPVDKPQTPIATSEEVAMSDEAATAWMGYPTPHPRLRRLRHSLISSLLLLTTDRVLQKRCIRRTISNWCRT